MADHLFVQLSFAVSTWQSRPRWRFGVLMLLLVALAGCEKKTQVNYSRWQGVRPDFEIQLDVDAASEAPVKEAGAHNVTTNSAIRFYGKVLLDPKDDSPGTTLVVEIGKPSGKGFLVFNSGSAVVPPCVKVRRPV